MDFRIETWGKVDVDPNLTNKNRCTIWYYMYLYIYDEGQSFQLKLQNELLSQMYKYLYGP